MNNEAKYQKNSEPMYLNEFHRKTTEESLKAIEEMKKTPINYEEEYARHFRMQKEQNDKKL
jgi:hypothetical protein